MSAIDSDSQFVGREGLCSRIVVERRVLNLVESILLAFSICELAPTERIEIHVTGAVCSVVAVDTHILPLCELQFVAVDSAADPKVWRFVVEVADVNLVALEHYAYRSVSLVILAVVVRNLVLHSLACVSRNRSCVLHLIIYRHRVAVAIEVAVG